VVAASSASSGADRDLAGTQGLRGLEDVKRRWDGTGGYNDEDGGTHTP